MYAHTRLKRQTRATAVAAVAWGMALGLLGAGCSDTPSTPGAGASGGATAGTTAGTETDPTAAADETSTVDAEHPACAQYIECVAALAPGAVAEAIDGFGPQGSCWTPQTVDLCIQSCIDARHDLMMVDPEAMECWDCRDDTECTDAPLSTCEPIRHTCVEATGLSGLYLLVLQLPLVPPLPSATLQFLADVDATIDADGNGNVAVELRALSLDLDSTTEPREEIGPMLNYELTVSDWSFDLLIEELSVLPEADPLDAEGFLLEDLELTGSFSSYSSWCGDTDGSYVFSDPYNVEPLFSTFAAIRLASRDERPLDFPLSCER